MLLRKITLYVFLTVSLISVNAQSAENSNNLTTSATFLLTQQATLNQVSIDETQFSVDVEFDYSHNNKGWFTWFEYSSTLNEQDIATLFDGSNSDAGTTQGASGNGRVQLSSLYYYDHTENAPLQWLVGVTQVTDLIDASDVAHDEIEQFLSGTLINNPTIAFPDYTLSARVNLRAPGAVDELVLLLANGQGLADRNGNYADAWQPFHSNFSVFSAIEWIRHLPSTRMSQGLWVNTHSQSMGWYTSVDFENDNNIVNLRLGIANTPRTDKPLSQQSPDDANDKSFIGLSVQYPVANGVISGGWTLTKTDLSVVPSKQIAEVYYRISYAENIHITPSIQWRKRQIIDSDNVSDMWLLGIRFQQDL